MPKWPRPSRRAKVTDEFTDRLDTMDIRSGTQVVMSLQHVNTDAQPPGLMTAILHDEQNAGRLIDQYESLAFEEVHASLLGLLPAPGATIRDIGAGADRDAAWFAARGADVVAVEPSVAMRTYARAIHPSALDAARRPGTSAHKKAAVARARTAFSGRCWTSADVPM